MPGRQRRQRKAKLNEARETTTSSFGLCRCCLPKTSTDTSMDDDAVRRPHRQQTDFMPRKNGSGTGPAHTQQAEKHIDLDLTRRKKTVYEICVATRYSSVSLLFLMSNAGQNL